MWESEKNRWSQCDGKTKGQKRTKNQFVGMKHQNVTHHRSCFLGCSYSALLLDLCRLHVTRSVCDQMKNWLLLVSTYNILFLLYCHFRSIMLCGYVTTSNIFFVGVWFELLLCWGSLSALDNLVSLYVCVCVCIISFTLTLEEIEWRA